MSWGDHYPHKDEEKSPQNTSEPFVGVHCPFLRECVQRPLPYPLP